MELAAIRFDGLPVSLDAAALLDKVEFTGGRAIDVQELTAFIRRNRPQLLKCQGHPCRLTCVVVAGTSAVDIREALNTRSLKAV